MSRAIFTKRVSAILPVNKDCVTLMFKDGTNATLTYRELRDFCNEMNGFGVDLPVSSDAEKKEPKVKEFAREPVVPVREPVAHAKYPKLHPLAKPRAISYES